MSAYELYLLLHVAAAMVWIGAAFLLVVLATRARASRDPARVGVLVEDAGWLGTRLFLPANLLVLVSAVLLVREGSWGLGALWIRLGLVGFVVSFLTGALFFGPGWGRMARLAEAGGIGSPVFEARLRRLLLGGWIDVGWLLAIVFVMIVKPTSGRWSALAVAAAIPIVFTLLAVALLQLPEQREAVTSCASPG